MIEKNALYQNLQSAFSTHHPKFPWPKRHDLEDQTDDFKAAFDSFVDETNEMVRREIIEHKEIERDHYVDLIKHKDAAIAKAKNAAVLPWFLIGLMIGAFILGLIAGTL